MPFLVLAAIDRSASSIPWWMATAIVLGWLATVGAIVGLARKRRRLARARRPEVLGGWEPPADRSLPAREPPDDRALPAGPSR